jgi:hypothetical protein
VGQGRYAKGNPGIGVKAAEFLIAKDPILLGADTAARYRPPLHTPIAAAVLIQIVAQQGGPALAWLEAGAADVECGTTCTCRVGVTPSEQYRY